MKDGRAGLDTVLRCHRPMIGDPARPGSIPCSGVTDR
jgi:hypothetical protein